MAKKEQAAKTQLNKQKHSGAKSTNIIESNDDIADLTELNGSSLETQTALLTDKRLPFIQRHALASQIAEVQGNRYLQKSITHFKDNKRTTLNRLDKGKTLRNSGSSQVVQRDSRDEPRHPTMQGPGGNYFRRRQHQQQQDEGVIAEGAEGGQREVGVIVRLSRRVEGVIRRLKQLIATPLEANFLARLRRKVQIAQNIFTSIAVLFGFGAAIASFVALFPPATAVAVILAVCWGVIAAISGAIAFLLSRGDEYLAEAEKLEREKEKLKERIKELKTPNVQLQEPQLNPPSRNQ